MRVVPGTQLTMELQPGLLRRYGTLREAVMHSVLNDPRGMKAVAADCDLTVSELSRRLTPAEGDPRSLDVNIFDRILESTGDLTPLHWLNAKYLADAETKKRAAVDTVVRILPDLLHALHDAGVDLPKRGGRSR
jgi:hypothetical protein